MGATRMTSSEGAGRHAGRGERWTRIPRRAGYTRGRGASVGFVEERPATTTGRRAMTREVWRTRAWGAYDGDLSKDEHVDREITSRLWSTPGPMDVTGAELSSTAMPVAAMAAVAVGMFVAGIDIPAHATECASPNEVMGGLAEGEDFWTNVLRYITFFITIVTGFITFAVKYVKTLLWDAQSMSYERTH